MTIKITKRQSEILEILVLNKKKPFGGIPGLTQTGIEAQGVASTTFSENIPKLLNRHLIRLVSKQTRGKEKWRYYDATVLGCLVWSQKQLESEDIVHIPVHFKRFFPFIEKHWKALEKIFEKDREGLAPDYFFIKCLKQFSINLQKNDDFFAYSRKEFEPIISTIRIDFEDYEIILKGDFVIDKPRLKLKRSYEVQPDFDERELWMQNISNKITFLFFYNMFQRPCSYDLEEGSISFNFLFDIFLNEDEIGNKLRKNYQRQLKQILSLIKKDSKLKEIIEKGLKMIGDVHSKPGVISFLNKSL